MPWRGLAHQSYDYLCCVDQTYFEKYGDNYSYEMCSRAQILRRDNENVVDMASMQYLIRYNDYLNDPYSNGSAWYTCLF